MHFADTYYLIPTWVTCFLSTLLNCHSLWHHPMYLHKLQSTCLDPEVMASLIGFPQFIDNTASDSVFFCWPDLCKSVINWQAILSRFPIIWFLVPQTQQGDAQAHFSRFQSCKSVGTFSVACVPWCLMVVGDPPPIPPYTQITLHCFFKDHSGHTQQPPP